MRFQLGETIYDSAAIDKLTLAMALRLQEQSGQMGRMITLGELDDMGKEIEKVPGPEQKNHPNMMWLTAVSIWSARTLAGESLTFEQAVSFPLSDLTILPEPTDHLPPRKAPPRKGGGAPAKRATSLNSRTSRSRSTAGS